MRDKRRGEGGGEEKEREGRMKAKGGKKNREGEGEILYNTVEVQE